MPGFYGEQGKSHIGSGAVRGPHVGYLERMFPGCVIRMGDPRLLVATVEDGVTACVDGRRPEGWNMQKVLRGPKIQGATEGTGMHIAKAQGRSEVDESSIEAACRVTVAAGYLPGLHDFEHDEPAHLHCGHGRLAYQGAFTDMMPPLVVSPRRMVEIIKDYGGIHVKLPGHHKEEKVRVNFRHGTTLEPNWEAFNIDAWVSAIFGINQDDILQNALATVIGLQSPARMIEYFV